MDVGLTHDEKAEIVEVYDRTVHGKGPVVCMMIKKMFVNGLNPVKMAFLKGKTYHVNLVLSPKTIVRSGVSKKYINANDETDCRANGVIKDMFPNNMEPTVAKLTGVTDCGVYLRPMSRRT